MFSKVSKPLRVTMTYLKNFRDVLFQSSHSTEPRRHGRTTAAKAIALDMVLRYAPPDEHHVIIFDTWPRISAIRTNTFELADVVPETLPYQIALNCPIGADVRHNNTTAVNVPSFM